MKEDDDHSIPLKIGSAVHRPIRDSCSMKTASIEKFATPTREPHFYNFCRKMRKRSKKMKNNEDHSDIARTILSARPDGKNIKNQKIMKKLKFRTPGFLRVKMLIL